MNDKIIHLEEQLLKKKLKAYEEDLKTNYLIVKRKEEPKAEMEFEINMEQYDLFHMQTHESYMELTVFPDLGLVEVKFADSDITCALAFDASSSIIELENISIDETEKMISYIQFTETNIYADALEPLPELDQIKGSSFYEEYLRVLIAIKYCLFSIAKMYI